MASVEQAVLGGRSGVGRRFVPPAGVDRSREGGRSNGLDRGVLAWMLDALGRPGLRVRLWDDAGSAGTEAPTLPGMRIADRGALYRLLLDPELNFGEMYVAGRLEIEGDLAEFLEVVYRALPRARYLDRPGFLQALRRNTLARAVRNIHHHYDIGNDFYRLWLDEQMVYTCAYFTEPTLSLEAAQFAKLDYVCRKLRLRAGDTVVEAGCGWGALALHMARQYGARVRAYNISGEQLAWARERARDAGLAQRVEFVEGDYREIDGRYDAFVSVGMLEHVGIADYNALGGVIRRCLLPSGRGLIHSIGRDFPRGMNAWIDRRIFPGACPPSLSQMMGIFEPHGFSVLDVENLRLHYASTLAHWSQRFEAAAGQVEAMFGPAFVRAWRLYLAGSLAAFRSGDMQLFQLTFSRSGCNRIPWSRRDLYLAAAPHGTL